MSTDSKKELIMKKLETVLASIIKGNSPDGIADHKYSSTVSYINRQYQQVTPDDIESKPKPWLILNNEGEHPKPIMSRNFESTIYFQIVGFVEEVEGGTNLDSLMNALQKDILLAILNDVSLGGICGYIVPTDIQTVKEMIFPFGGFSMNFECVYTFNGLNF